VVDVRCALLLVLQRHACTAEACEVGR
jgi:hypothetical protein